MKVYIKDIRSEGIELHYKIAAESIGLTPDDILQFIKPIDVYAKVERVEKTVLSKTKVSSRYKSFCCRSLVDVERDWSEEFVLDFEIKRDTEYIELDEDIRQEVILSLPIRVLSDEEIKKEAVEHREIIRKFQQSDKKAVRTYQPFADLKDI